MKSFRIAQKALFAVFVCSILMNTMLMNILQWINLLIRFFRIYRIRLRMLYNLSSSSLIIYLNVLESI